MVYFLFIAVSLVIVGGIAVLVNGNFLKFFLSEVRNFWGWATECRKLTLLANVVGGGAIADFLFGSSPNVKLDIAIMVIAIFVAYMCRRNRVFAGLSCRMPKH